MLTRRHFIRNMGMALPVFSLSQFLLSSCSKNENIDPNKKRIGIIGAGISGLHAAMLLNQYNKYDIEVLEASDRIGGRINSKDYAFNTCNVELGASSIYGSNNSWYDISKLSQLRQVSFNAPASYVIGGDMKSNTEMCAESDYNSMLSKLESMSSFQPTGDLSIEQYMEQSLVPERVRFIFEEKTEQCIGTSVDRASVIANKSEGIEKIQEMQYMPNNGQSFSRIIRDHYGEILPKVTNNVPVTQIDYSGERIKVTDANQVNRYYDRLIVTVPLSILKIKSGQNYGITFIPDLPDKKVEAMEHLGMDAGVRIILKLNSRFWNQDSKSIYSDGKYGRFDVVHEDNISNIFILSSTIQGKFAEEYLNLKSEQEIINDIKAEWQRKIGLSAANAIIDHQVEFWAKNPYIQGTFSYHKVGGGIENRVELARAIDDRLFFAGEATNTENNSGTVHGAIDTSVRAVQQVVKTL